MNTKLYIRVITCLIIMLSYNQVYGENIRKNVCNGRTIQEVIYDSEYGNRYKYTINTNITKADSIKKTKYPLSVDVKYPTWNSKQAFKHLQEYVITCIYNKGKCHVAKDITLDFHYLLDDTGEIISLKIRTSRSLYDFYTPAEVISIFDEINKFRFPVPVTIWPSESIGWEDMSMGF